MQVIVKYGIGFGLLAWVVGRYWQDNAVTGAPGLRTLLAGPIAGEWLVLAAMLTAGALALQLIRWYLLVRALDLPFTLRNACRLGMVGIFFNTFLPGSVGGDLLKAYFIARENRERKTRAVATVLIDRALGLFGLVLFVAVLGTTLWLLGDARLIANPELQRLIQLMAACSGVTIVGYVLLGYLPQRRVDRFARRLRWLPKVGGPLAEFWYAVWIYRQRPRTILGGVALSAISHVALVLAFHTASRVFPAQGGEAEQPASLAEHIVIAPIGFIVQALPVSPGGVGIGEATFAGLYQLSGRSASRGVIARLAMRVVEWLIGLLGYLLYLRMKKELPLTPIGDDADRLPETRPPTLQSAPSNQVPPLPTAVTLAPHVGGAIGDHISPDGSRSVASSNRPSALRSAGESSSERS